MFPESGPTAAVIQLLRQELLRLARREDDLAAEEAATVQYWEPLPPSVLAHRAAARALMAEALGLSQTG